VEVLAKPRAGRRLRSRRDALGDYSSTAALIERGRDDWLAARAKAASVSLDEIKILSPVTTPCRIYCQGANYRRHMIESGMDPDAKLFNMFFTKSDASVASAHGRVTRPSHVVLLDYEIELALIFRRPISSPIMVERGSLKDYVFGIAIANDLSARDVQLPQTQFFKGKSYRGFCPLGPWLTALDDDEFDQLGNLELELAVNGTVRQRDSTRNLVFKPAETISELSTFASIAAGDVLLTGKRLRAARTAPCNPPHRAAASRPRVLEAVPQVANASAAIPATRRHYQRPHLQC